MTGLEGNGFSSRSDAAVLAERLQVGRESVTTRARDPQAELKSRIHRACIARLGAAFLNLEGTNELEPRVRRLVREQLNAEEMPLSPSERERLEQQIADEEGRFARAVSALGRSLLGEAAPVAAQQRRSLLRGGRR